MVVRKGALAAAVVCALAAGLAGCSGGSGGGSAGPGGGLPLGLDGLSEGWTGGTALADRTPARIAEEMTEAMDGLRSLRIEGRFTEDGQVMGIDMALTDDGRCTGSMTMGGGTAEVVGTDDRMYMRGDERFWRSQSGGAPGDAAAVDILKDRWIDAGKRGSDDDFEGFCDLDSLMGAMGEPDVSRTAKGELTRVAGREAVPLVERDGTETTTGYVANDLDRPYLLRVEVEGGTEPGVMDFTDHDGEVEIEEPDPSEVLDLDDVGGRGPTEDV